MDSDQFIKELKDFIDSNVGHKFNNSDVDKRFYDKIYERKQFNKRTNVKAIKNVKKLVQYQIASQMLNYCCNDIIDYIYELTDFTYREDFKNMFSNIEYETPELRKINNPKINYINGEFFMDYNNDKVKLTYDSNTVVYSLIPLFTYIDVNQNCWDFINYKCEAPLDSILISVPWEINGNVIYKKDSDTYNLSNVSFIATYDLSNISILGRYSGLAKSPFDAEPISFEGRTIEDFFEFEKERKAILNKYLNCKKDLGPAEKVIKKLMK